MINNLLTSEHFRPDPEAQRHIQGLMEAKTNLMRLLSQSFEVGQIRKGMKKAERLLGCRPKTPHRNDLKSFSKWMAHAAQA